MSLKNNDHGEPWRFSRSSFDESSYCASGQGLPLPPQPQSCSPSWSPLQNSSSASQKVAQASSKVLDKIPQPTKLSANVFATRPIFEQQSAKENVIANPAQAEATTSVDKSSRRKKRSRLSSTSSPQIKNVNYTKRTRTNQEKSLRKMIKGCTDKKMLFDLLKEELKAETLHQENKEKSNDYTDKESQTEALTESPVNFANLGNIALMEAFEKLIKDFSMLVSDNFLEMMLETFSDRLGASKLLNLLKVEQLKIALLEKFSPIEFLDLLHHSGVSQVSQQILSSVSDEHITHYISSRNRQDPNTFVPLLNILLERGPKILTKETKSRMKNALMEKCSPSELNSLMHEILNHVVPTPTVTEVVIDN